MSLPKRMDTDNLDLSLKHTLKNWINRSHSPTEGRERLLNAVVQPSLQPSKPKVSKITGFVSMTLNENFLEIYLERFKSAPYNSLQPGAIYMNFASSVIAQ
ncbi:MAG: hypothetical protein MUO62_06000 [Anaerolineales bacterium]|nr:hypothetical protein [Anaerolineales bacterium]